MLRLNRSICAPIGISISGVVVTQADRAPRPQGMGRQSGVCGVARPGALGGLEGDQLRDKVGVQRFSGTDGSDAKIFWPVHRRLRVGATEPGVVAVRNGRLRPSREQGQWRQDGYQHGLNLERVRPAVLAAGTRPVIPACGAHSRLPRAVQLDQECGRVDSLGEPGERRRRILERGDFESVLDRRSHPRRGVRVLNDVENPRRCP